MTGRNSMDNKMSEQKPIIYRLEGVRYAYAQSMAALAGIDLEIRAGEQVAILGANGCGKTTLLHLMDGLMFPQQGKITAFGESLTEHKLEQQEFRFFFRSKVGLIFQDADVQLFSPTVYDEIAFGPLQLELSEQEVTTRVEDLLRILALQHVQTRSPHH